jgi:hypothetical protein
VCNAHALTTHLCRHHSTLHAHTGTSALSACVVTSQQQRGAQYERPAARARVRKSIAHSRRTHNNTQMRAHTQLAYAAFGACDAT